MCPSTVWSLLAQDAAHAGHPSQMFLNMRRVSPLTQWDPDKTCHPHQHRPSMATASLTSIPAAGALQSKHLVANVNTYKPTNSIAHFITNACFHGHWWDVCRQLPEVWQKTYDNLICQDSSGIDIQPTTGGKYNLCKDDFLTCAPGAWINDKIINTIAGLLQV